MSQSPYAQLGSEYIETGPRRTSAMAIVSLVLAIVSIVPLFCIFLGSGTLAMIFGGAALMFIHKERGRLGGTGLAAAGIIIGLLVTVVQIVAVIAASQAMGFFKQQLAGPVDQSLRAIDQGDFKTARKLLTPEADAKITDEMLTTFAATYKKEFGAYQNAPDSLLDVVRTWFKAASAMRQLDGQGGNAFPFPVHFAKNDAIVIVVWDPKRLQQSKGSGPTNFAFPTTNIGLLSADGRSVWITDERPTPGPAQFQFGPPTSSTAPPPPPQPTPTAPEAPAPAATPTPAEARPSAPAGPGGR